MVTRIVNLITPESIYGTTLPRVLWEQPNITLRSKKVVWQNKPSQDWYFYFILLYFIYLSFMCMAFCCLNACLCTACVHCDLGDRTGATDSVIIPVLGSRKESSGGAISALTHWAIYLSSLKHSCFIRKFF